jgi:hypothetical protein
VTLSGLIFVALAAAWAAYLIPKAVRHHDEVARSRSVDRFSSTMRVLARREPVGTRDARLVVTPARGGSAPVVTTKATRPTAAQVKARRAAARLAAQRRRRVLGAILGLNLVVAVLAAFGVIGWAWQAVPATLLVAWLVACRLMVRSERATARPLAVPGADAEPAAVPEHIATERDEAGFELVAGDAETTTIPAIAEPLHVEAPRPDGMWDPVPVTLPTYVTKPAATRRTVRTIDLGAPGTWTSGRTDEDAAIAREADAAASAARDEAPARRATGT